jgi:hypothetical protein
MITTVPQANGTCLQDGDDLAAFITKRGIRIWMAERTVKIIDATVFIERIRALIDAAKASQASIK